MKPRLFVVLLAAGGMLRPVVAADMILNEYNAVGDTGFLENEAADPFWGSRLGNGGDWFELVVITDHLDIRGWDLVIENDVGGTEFEQFILTFTMDASWMDLRSGTIITVSEDLPNNIADYQPELGRWWINVRAADSTDGTYITAAQFKVSNNMWQLTIRDSTDQVIFGPAGEGIAPLSGVGNDEVCKLEANPDAGITPLAAYNDGSSSTFGAPNVWNGGKSVQDFSVLRSVVPFTQLTAVRINEVNTHTDLPDEDWIELINTTASPIDVGGWFLSDDVDEPDLDKFTIPSPTVIPSMGYIVLLESDVGFALSSMGDQVVLSEGDGVSMTGARDFVEFGAVENGVSFGRFPNGAGPLYRMSASTAGAANATPLVGPIVINEIMYHPPDPPPEPVTFDPEFIELFNSTDQPIDLFVDYGECGVFPWSISGGVDFVFSTNTVLGAGEHLLIVNFDPVADAESLQMLRGLYNLCASNIVGPFTGALSNFSDTVRLRRPDTPNSPDDPDDPCGAPNVLIDEVTYVDFGDWPVEADGAGSSLHRVDPLAVGNLASNWAASGGFGGSPLRPNSDGGACVDVADCADIDNDGIRDDNCVWWACIDGHCAGTDVGFGDMGGQFGACAPDCATDGNDRFHALNCFSNIDPNAPPPAGYTCEVDPPNAMNVDAGGQFGSCAPDGVCDGNDAFAALNAFGGLTSCTCALGAPEPGFEPVVVDRTSLRLRASRTRLGPEQEVAVDVYLDEAVSDLRGYQLHMGVTGGRRGQLELVDIVIDDHGATAAHVFGGQPFWQAFNVGTGQMVAGLDTPGVATEAHAYLATFVFRATPLASGVFHIDIRCASGDSTDRTFLFPTLPTGTIEIRQSNSVAVHVGGRVRGKR